jgi:uncharacterized membrane-anchored protein YjiN (DUF445 family)
VIEDLQRAAELRAMKRRATGLLVVVVAVFAGLLVLSRRSGAAWLPYAIAAAEGSLVGGLADWFAVTAIFRHPLGLPIPHTAVIRARKDQFGATLGAFVRDNFLSADVVGERVRASRLPERLAAWLSRPVNAARCGAAISDALVAVVDIVRDEDVHRLLHEEVERAIGRVSAADVAARVLLAATRDGRHRDALDTLLRAAANVLEEEREPLRDRFGESSPWWLPGAVEDRIFDRLIDGVTAFLRSAADDPQHEFRTAIETRIAEFATRLETDEALRGRLDEFVRDAATSPDLRAWVAAMWDDAKLSLREQAHDPSSRLRTALSDVALAAGHRLADDPVLQARLADAAEAAVRYVATNHGDEIGDLIASTIERWDADETSNKLELLLGRDLQFIRINGTIVGGIAGLTIHAVALAVG